MRRTNEFGRLLRRRRVEASVSLRRLAKLLGISAVYLGEVERGVRGPLNQKYWQSIADSVPTIRLDELQRAAQLSRGVQLDLASAPVRYQNLGLALARRISRRDLSEREVERLLRVLGGDDDE